MPQLFLVLEEGNTALLTRALGDIPAPRFASQGLLSTIASWCMESCGHELRVIASTNVRVVYRRFDNHLLFVLVTSNLLLQTELLQLHLETLYDVLLLLLGSAALVLDTAAKISVLRSKLKAPDVQRAVDSLVADDTLAPCILLPVPQLVGLPLRDKAGLQAALAKVVATLGCAAAAVIGEGYYLAATQGWRTVLSPREQLLVQHLATQQSAHHHADSPPPDLTLHLAKRSYESPLRLRLLRLQEAVLLAVLFESSGGLPPPLQDCEDQLRSHLEGVSHTLERPLWLSPPVPQFSTFTFDLALVVEHSPPSAMLLWGHGGGAAVQQGFNPLVSPSLRKQFGSSPGPMVGRLSYRPPSVHRDESLAAGGDGLQLFFRSTLDTLVSFALQTWPQMPPALQAALQDRKAAGGGEGGGGGAGTGTAGTGGASAATSAVASAAASAAATARSRNESPRPKLGAAVSVTATTTTASSPTPQHQLNPVEPCAHSPQLLSASTANTPRQQHQPQQAQFNTPQPQPQAGRGQRGTSPASRLGLGAIRRISSSSVSGAARLQALFGRGSSSTQARGPAAGPATAGALSARGQEPAADGSGGGVGALGWLEEPCELADVPYEEVHSVIEGARLLALLDRSSKASIECTTTAGATQDVVDVFVAFPKRVGRQAALEAATKIRAVYLMSCHDDY